MAAQQILSHQIMRTLTDNIATFTTNGTLDYDIPTSLDISNDGMFYSYEELVNEIPFFDSSHDFGGNRGSFLATDKSSLDRETKNNTYNAMTLTNLWKTYQSESWNKDAASKVIIGNIPSKPISKFSYSKGKLSLPFDDIEDYCMLLAIKTEIINKNKLNLLKCYKYDPTKEDELKEQKKNIYNFFLNYKDASTDTINFIIDTPGDMTKILNSDKSNYNEFANVILQETVRDSAKGKSTHIPNTV
jgi:hypothetical protein